MATIVPHLAAPSTYKDHQFKGSQQEWISLLNQSCTLYVGNLSFYTTEEQIYEIFSKCGEIKRIIMGLDRVKKTPCGFCFVEYYTHEDAVDCMKYINGTRVDERVIRTDLDPGFREGRQYGRGKSGGQVRDEYRQEFDPGRGGWGHLKAQEEARRAALEQRMQAQLTHEVPTGQAMGAPLEAQAAGSAQTQNANAPAVNAATGASNVAATADGATAQGPAAETATETAPENARFRGDDHIQEDEEETAMQEG